MENIKIGIELECILNSQLLDVERGGYHRGVKINDLKEFTAECDSSIHGFDFEGWSKPVEFVSKTFCSVNAFRKGVNNFKKFISQDGVFELNKVLSFNSTCGSHIHFSSKELLFNDKMTFYTLSKTRLFFINEIKKSNINNKDAIILHYNRTFSKKITKRNWKRKLFSRYLEFNFSSELDEQGLEWRALNLLGIKTWKEFDEMIEIFCRSLEFLLKNTLKYKIAKNIKLKVPQIMDSKEENYVVKTINPAEKIYGIDLEHLGGVENVQLEYSSQN